MTQQTNQVSNNTIRTMVRSMYDIQDLRIQMGNRITANFKDKLGQSPKPGKVMSEKELEKEQKKVLEQLRLSYKRITDGVVAKKNAKIENDDEKSEGKMPTLKKFVGDNLITTYAELALMDQYMSLLKDEERHFKRLEDTLKGISIYDEFLSRIKGIGPAMAGVIISEIDITKAEYPSSLWMFAGLDSLKVGVYTKNGKECVVPVNELESRFENGYEVFYAEGQYEASVQHVGRSRQSHCLVNCTYTNKAGEEATRLSITYNPFLKTKLMGVLASSFLRAGTSTVDGKVMGNAKRLELALSEGMSPDVDHDDDNVKTFLRLKGHTVIVEPSEYGKCYYDYKTRLQNDQRHIDKTDLHRHNMALRFMIKRFLVNLYSEWRKLSGLPCAEEYGVAKLGLVHGVASQAKNDFVNRRFG